MKLLKKNEARAPDWLCRKNMQLLILGVRILSSSPKFEPQAGCWDYLSKNFLKIKKKKNEATLCELIYEDFQDKLLSERKQGVYRIYNLGIKGK